MNVEKRVREFSYNGIRLPDPNVNLSVEEVRDLYAGTSPDIATAAIEGPEAMGTKLTSRFSRHLGRKVRVLMLDLANLPASTLWF
jgi:PRTRC genetic system protein C